MKVFAPLMKMQVDRLKRAAGPAQPRMMGFPVLLLTTVGAKTGVERTHIVGGFPEGENAWVVVASNGGAADHPQWFVNMAKNPDQISIQVGERKLQVTASCLIGPERIEALNRVAAIAPRYGDYPKKTDREIPVIRLTAAA